MEYISDPETVKCFWNALAGSSEHHVREWTIFYPLVKVIGSCELLIVVSKTPCSLLVNYETCYIDGLQEYSGGP